MKTKRVNVDAEIARYAAARRKSDNEIIESVERVADKLKREIDFAHSRIDEWESHKPKPQSNDRANVAIVLALVYPLGVLVWRVIGSLL